MADDNLIPEFYSLLVEQISLITKALSEDNQILVLTQTDILLATLDESFIEENKLEPLKKKINYYLTNEENYRYLRMNQRIKSEMETAIEYYDSDIGGDLRLHYRTKLEKELMTLNREIRGFLALIIKKKLRDDIDVE